MDPIIHEMSRSRTPIREDVLRRWARYLRDVIQPQLDELAAHKAEQTEKPKSRKAS